MGIRDDLMQYGRMAIGTIGSALTDMATKGYMEKSTTPANETGVERAEAEPKSLLWDPYSIVEQLGYKDRPSSISYGTLKAITYRMPIVQAIIQTRINQIAAFCVPQQDRYQLGFKIKLRDSKRQPTAAELKKMGAIERMFMQTGVTDNPVGRDTFETFTRKIAYDMLTYDQACFEVVPNRAGLPAEWYAADATTIRLADTATVSSNEDDENAIKYVQIYDGMIIAEYTQNEMCFGVRNPRSDLRLNGYGVSELEMLIPTVTSLLYSWDFNQKYFTQGTAAKGIINFKGTVPGKQLDAFRRQWYTQISSAENAWKTPIINSQDEIQYINMQQSARDMEFSAWMDFQIKVACSLYNIDPVEVNFQYGNVGQKSALASSSNKEKITESKERGLRPLLRFLSSIYNHHIVWPIEEDFEFAFVGLDAQTRSDTIKINETRVKTVMTVDELRAEDDLPPLPDGKGEVILDSVWLQNSMSKEGGGSDGLDIENGKPPERSEDPVEDDYEKLLMEYEGMDDKKDEEEIDNRKSNEGVSKSWIANI